MGISRQTTISNMFPTTTMITNDNPFILGNDPIFQGSWRLQVQHGNCLFFVPKALQRVLPVTSFALSCSKIHERTCRDMRRMHEPTCKARCTRVIWRARRTRAHSEQEARAHVQSKLNERTRAANYMARHVQPVARESMRSTLHERTRAANCRREHAQQIARENTRSKLHEGTGAAIARESTRSKLQLET